MPDLNQLTENDWLILFDWTWLLESHAVDLCLKSTEWHWWTESNWLKQTDSNWLTETDRLNMNEWYWLIETEWLQVKLKNSGLFFSFAHKWFIILLDSDMTFAVVTATDRLKMTDWY